MAVGRDKAQGQTQKMHPVFLSDLHLKPEGDEARIKLLVRFLKSLTGRVDHVYGREQQHQRDCCWRPAVYQGGMSIT